MGYKWTRIDRAELLSKLNKLGLPFRSYRFSGLDEGLREIGSGGFATVYDAEKKDGTAGYAIKVVGMEAQDVDSGDFLRKTGMIGQVIDPSIIHIMDSVVVRVWIDEYGNYQMKDGKILAEKYDNYFHSLPEKRDEYAVDFKFLLMKKYLPICSDGFSGSSAVQKNLSANESEVKKLADQIGNAVKYLHAHNIIHRDIKMDNIYYDPKKKRYMLGDYGTVKKTENGIAWTTVYTKGYAAPEVMKRDLYDQTVDIFSLGMVLYVALNHFELPEVEVSADSFPDRPEECSFEMWEIIRKMIAYNPEDRYQTAEMFLSDLYGTIYGKSFSYQYSHVKTVKVVMIAIGIFCASALIYMERISASKDISIEVYLFAGLCLLHTLAKKKWPEEVSTAFLFAGYMIFYAVKNGLSLYLLVYPVIFGFDFLQIPASIGILLFPVLKMLFGIQAMVFLQKYMWVIFMLSMMFLLLFVEYGRYSSISKISKYNLVLPNLVWFCAMAYYTIFLLQSILYEHIDWTIYKLLGIYSLIARLTKNDMRLIGLVGLCLTILWKIREWISIWMMNENEME